VETEHRRKAEKYDIAQIRSGEMVQHPLTRKRKKNTACAVSQQGKAYNHVGEMVPLDDGEKLHQKYLICQSRSGYQGNREIRNPLHGLNGSLSAAQI